MDAYKRGPVVLLDLLVPVVVAVGVTVALLDLLVLVVAEVVVATELLVSDDTQLLSCHRKLYYNS